MVWKIGYALGNIKDEIFTIFYFVITKINFN